MKKLGTINLNTIIVTMTMGESGLRGMLEELTSKRLVARTSLLSSLHQLDGQLYLLDYICICFKYLWWKDIENLSLDVRMLGAFTGISIMYQVLRLGALTRISIMY